MRKGDLFKSRQIHSPTKPAASRPCHSNNTPVHFFVLRLRSDLPTGFACAHTVGSPRKPIPLIPLGTKEKQRRGRRQRHGADRAGPSRGEEILETSRPLSARTNRQTQTRARADVNLAPQTTARDQNR